MYIPALDWNAENQFGRDFPETAVCRVLLYKQIEIAVVLSSENILEISVLRKRYRSCGMPTNDAYPIQRSRDLLKH